MTRWIGGATTDVAVIALGETVIWEDAGRRWAPLAIGPEAGRVAVSGITDPWYYTGPGGEVTSLRQSLSVA
jgi:hypothetical protein